MQYWLNVLLTVYYHISSLNELWLSICYILTRVNFLQLSFLFNLLLWFFLSKYTCARLSLQINIYTIYVKRNFHSVLKLVNIRSLRTCFEIAKLNSCERKLVKQYTINMSDSMYNESLFMFIRSYLPLYPWWGDKHISQPNTNKTLLKWRLICCIIYNCFSYTFLDTPISEKIAFLCLWLYFCYMINF